MISRLGGLFEATFMRALIAVSPQRELHGLRVTIIAAGIDEEGAFARMEEVLNTLATDPVNLRRAQRQLRWIIIATGPFAAYWRRLRACAIGGEVLLNQPQVWVASVIVHEACHARTDRYRRHDVERREMLCARRQLRFLESLGGTEALSEGLKAHMSTGAWFSERQRRKTALLRLRALRAPGWAVSWAERKVAEVE